MVVGNHGAEGPWQNSDALGRAKRINRAWMKSFEKRLRSIQGILIEDKIYSISIHYSLVRNRNATRRKILEIAKTLKPRPRVIRGKKILNFVPLHLPDKGKAVLLLEKHLKNRHTIFMGDDFTDEDVFKLRHPRIFDIRVGKKSSSKARYFVKNQTEVEQVLRRMLSVFESGLGIKSKAVLNRRAVFRPKRLMKVG